MIVHFMWGLWDEKPLPEIIKNRHENTCRILGMEYKVWNKEDIYNLADKFALKENIPAFSDLFRKIPRGICQADIGRYLILYMEGGIYLDNDIEFKNKGDLVTDILTYPNGVWFVEKIVSLDKLGPKEKKIARRIANYALGVFKPNSPIFLDIILESVNRLVGFLESNNTILDEDVIWVTGPDVVTTIVEETKNTGYLIYSKSKSDFLFKHLSKGSWRSKSVSDPRLAMLMYKKRRN